MSACVFWEGRVTHMGYGVRGAELAHRALWEDRYGPIPVGMVIHHDCENKLCVNLAHLRCITHVEHNRIHNNAAAWHERQRSKTHCPQGHEYTPENTRVKRGKRHCRECMRAYNREYYARNRERLLPEMRERARRYAAERNG